MLRNSLMKSALDTTVLKEQLKNIMTLLLIKYLTLIMNSKGGENKQQMPNGQQPGQEPEKIDPKKELERARTNLHNTRFQVTMQEAIVKKLEELSR